jgi:hypothetical protein
MFVELLRLELLEVMACILVAEERAQAGVEEGLSCL